MDVLKCSRRVAVRRGRRLAGVVSEVLEPRLLLAAVSWDGGGDGVNWNSANNWSNNQVPTISDDVFINSTTFQGGTFTVQLNGTPAVVKTLTLGGASGSQTLQVNTNLTLGIGISVVGANGVLRLAATLGGAGSILTNQGAIRLSGGSLGVSTANAGTLIAEASSAITGSISNNATGLLEVQANATFGNASLAVSTGFTNNGTIRLLNTHPTENRASELTIGSGTLTNASIGIIESVSGPAEGPYRIIANVNNQGLIRTSGPGASLTIGFGAVTHVHAGTIELNGAGVFFQGTGTTFASGNVVTGPGKLSFRSTVLSLQQPLLMDGFDVAVLAPSVVGGAGSITVMPGTRLEITNAEIGVPLVNQGRILAGENAVVSGSFASTSGSQIEIRGRNSGGVLAHGRLTFASGFVNRGSIRLTTEVVSGPADATLVVTSGTLTNALEGSIISLPGGGNGGNRRIEAQINNQGLIQSDQFLRVEKSGAQHTHSAGGSIVANADVRFTMTGAGARFTNAGGTMQIGASHEVLLEGPFTYSSGSLHGPGRLFLLNPSGTASLVNGALQTLDGLRLQITAGSVGGTGSISNLAGSTLGLRLATINVPLNNSGLLLAGPDTAVIGGALTNATGATIEIVDLLDGVPGSATLTVSNGFVNNGTIELRKLHTGNLNLTFNVTNGTFTNAPGGVLRTGEGIGTRSFGLRLNNQGTLDIRHVTVLNKPGVAHTNSGLIDVAPGGTLTIEQSGFLASFTNTGTLNVADNFLWIMGGAFNFNGGALTGAGSSDQGFFVLDGVSATLNAPLVSDQTILRLENTTIIGTASLTALGTTMINSTVNTSFHSPAPLSCFGINQIGGTFTTGPTTFITIGAGTQHGDASLTIANTFTSHGGVQLFSPGANDQATLTVTSGQLINAAGSTIQTMPGNGAVTIFSELINHGTITLLNDLTIARTSADHVSGGTINVTGGNLTFQQSGVTPTVLLNNAGSLHVAAGRQVHITTGPLNLLGGARLSGSGTVIASVVQNQNGTVAPGASAGALTITGNYLQTANARLEIEIGGLAPGSGHDQLIVSGTATLNGTIDITPINNFDAGTFLATVDALTAGSISGQFSTLTFTPTASGRGFGVSYTSAAARVSFGPSAPSMPDLTPGSDSGVSNSDNITNVTLPTFTGTGELLSTVHLFADGAPIGSAQVADGSWSVTATAPLAEGVRSITAQAFDAAGDPSVVSAPLLITIDTTPPTLVADPSFHFATAPHELSYRFSENVGPGLSNGSFLVQKLGSGLIDKSITYDAATDTARVRFPTFANGVLDDGRYISTANPAAITDVAGNALAAGNVFNFLFLRGDANNDGIVNLADFNILASNFGQSNRDFTQGDFNYDGVVNLTDFNILASNFGVALGASAASGVSFAAGDDEPDQEGEQLL